MILVLAVLNALLLVTGQIFWKLGLNRAGEFSWTNVWPVFSSPAVLAGIGIYVLSLFLWFYLLSRASLSFIYPVQSLAYVFGVLAGLFLFGETVPPVRWAGVLLIVVGVYLVVRG
ncbi:EamA family transporter [Calderihabitans maritimus]|uniref:EamA domain-containing protein n=1 Tax=Calderihabitans maritimus TaxID=1246530 RepID=A0A1Z5HV46_9FIRM|nr:EamA family transporter [Calderihabitans maritimus]GAW93409.1 hypothetical protein KKC1_25430 [Calderihabitans maritimus]